jgi:hypothetical protein
MASPVAAHLPHQPHPHAALLPVEIAPAGAAARSTAVGPAAGGRAAARRRKRGAPAHRSMMTCLPCDSACLHACSHAWRLPSVSCGGAIAARAQSARRAAAAEREQNRWHAGDAMSAAQLGALTWFTQAQQPLAGPQMRCARVVLPAGWWDEAAGGWGVGMGGAFAWPSMRRPQSAPGGSNPATSPLPCSPIRISTCCWLMARLMLLPGSVTAAPRACGSARKASRPSASSRAVQGERARSTGPRRSADSGRRAAA